MLHSGATAIQYHEPRVH